MMKRISTFGLCLALNAQAQTKPAAGAQPSEVAPVATETTPVGARNPEGAGVVRSVKHPSYKELMAPKDPKESNWDKLPITDSEGKKLTLDKFRGKLLLVNFFFTHCPDVCPPQTAALNTVLNKLGDFERKSVQFVSITIDPDNDTQAELAKYKKKFVTKDPETWTFARTDKDTLKKLGTHFGALNGDPSKPLDHRARLYLIKDDGAYLLSYEAAPVDIDRMTKDLTDATRTFIKPKQNAEKK